MEQISENEKPIKRKIQTKLLLPAAVESFNLPPREMVVLSVMVKQIQRRLKKSESKRIQPYISLSRDFLRQLAGGNYKQSINNLIKNGLISVFVAKTTKHESYLPGALAHSLGRESICKKYKLSYRLQKQVQSGELIEVVRGLRPLAAKEFTETAVVDCPATQKVVDNFKAIRIDDLDNLTPEESINAQGIAAGITNAKRSSNGRIYHRLANSNSKESRKRASVGGEKLMTVDGSAFQPFLMANFISDPAEKQKWLSFCHNDPYLAFAGGDVSKRSLVKGKFQQAISAKKKGKTATAIIELIKQKFPSLFAWIAARHEAGKSVQSALQKLESDIVIPAFLAASFWCLPIHDALLVKASDRTAAANHLRAAILDNLGYEIPVV